MAVVGVNEINAPGQERVGTRNEPLVPTQPTRVPELGETLQVRNIGTSTLRFQWNSRLYEIPPGASDFMPFDGVKVYVGDPRATNAIRTLRDSIGVVSFLPDRATEVRRLRLLYSAPFGEYMSAADVGGIFVNSPDDPSLRRSGAFDGVRIPQVEVYNIRNERIITVLDDPDGTMNIPVQVTQGQLDRTDQLSRVIDQQQNLINVMAERLGIDPHGPATDNTPDFLGERGPEDEPDDPDTPVERHEDGTPVMVYEPRTETVKPKVIKKVADPTTLDDLPRDKS